MNQSKMVKGLLFDPYKQELRPVEVRNDIHVWHKVLKCDCCDVNRLASDHDGTAIDIWFDDEFLLKAEPGPSFAVQLPSDNGEVRIYHGYALLFGSNNEGETTDLSLFNQVPKPLRGREMEYLVQCIMMAFRLKWERWEARVKRDNYIDEQMRMPELEMPQDFHYLSVLD